MSARDKSLNPVSADRGRFATTRWSLVLAAGQRDGPGSQEALATLCRIYWYPLYAYVRRRGSSADEAQDLTQEFFTQFLEKDYLRVANRERGKFRSFLLTAFKHFLSKERDRAHTQKRGGGRSFVSLDFQGAEHRYKLEAADDATPDRIFERRWALTLLDQVLVHLREEYTKAGKTKLFDRLKICLMGEKNPYHYAALAEELQMTEGAVKVAAHRLRQRYGELLRAEIAQTVADPKQIEDELRDLFAAVRTRKSLRPL